MGELLWPARYGDKELTGLESSLGSYGAAGQLQQRPAPRSGGMFKREWFEIVKDSPADARRVRWWDLAATKNRAGIDPDYTAGVLLSVKDGIYYIEDVLRTRDTPGVVENLIKQTALLDMQRPNPPLIYMEQEPGSGGKNTIDHYARVVLVGLPFRGKPSVGSKEARAEPLSAAAEAGNVKVVSGRWNRDFLDEIQTFLRGAHMDQVDAASGAFNVVSKVKGLPKVWWI